MGSTAEIQPVLPPSNDRQPHARVTGSSLVGPPVPERAHPRALWRFYYLRDRSLVDIVAVMQACKLRLGIGGGKEERAWLGIQLYLEDQATPDVFPGVPEFRAWRAADPDRRRRIPTYEFIAEAFGGWAGAAAAFGAAPPKLDVLARRKTALGPAPSDGALRAMFDVWAESVPEHQPLIRDDLLGFMQEVHRLVLQGRLIDPRLQGQVLPRSWDSYYRRFRKWEVLLADRGKSHRSFAAMQAARKAEEANSGASADPPRPVRLSWKDRLDDLGRALRWAAAPSRGGRLISYPEYDRRRPAWAAQFLAEMGFEMPSSCTVRRYLGQNNWMRAKLAAGVLTAHEARQGLHKNNRTDEELLEIAWRAVLQEGPALSKPGYRRWRGQYRTDARAENRDDWCPSAENLEERLGGPEHSWSEVTRRACEYTPPLGATQEAVL